MEAVATSIDALAQYKGLIELSAAIAGALIGALVGALAAFGFTLRAQRRQLKAEIENAARLHVIDALNQAEFLLIEVYASLSSAQRALTSGEPIDPRGIADELITTLWKAINDQNQYNWENRLREYGSIFPYTRSIKNELAGRHARMNDAITKLLALLKPMVAPTPVTRGFTQEFMDLLNDARVFSNQQRGLMQDLTILLLNRSLGKLFGNEEPITKIRGSGPYIVDGYKHFKIIDVNASPR